MHQSSPMFTPSQAARGRVPADPAGAEFVTVRQRMSKSGRIIFNAGQSTIGCTIRAMSDTDAEISLANASGVPQVFKLAVGDSERLRTCRVVTRDERGLTVTFT